MSAAGNGLTGPLHSTAVRLDLHSHSRYSPDSKVDPVDLVRVARRAGLDGIAITDHNALGGAGAAVEAAAGHEGFLVVPAIEVSSSDGHILGYGVRANIARDLTPAETLERIEAAGGIAVAAHPYRFWSGLGEAATTGARFTAYEVLNARTLRRGNARAMALADRRHVGRVGGSDAHFLDEVGRAVTVIDGGPGRVDDVLQAIAQHRTTVEGRSRGAGGTVRYVTKAVGEWIRRGMRRI